MMIPVALVANEFIDRSRQVNELVRRNRVGRAFRGFPPVLLCRTVLNAPATFCHPFGMVFRVAWKSERER